MVKKVQEENILIHIGENASDNWKLIDESQPQHLWFHVADHPSAHIVLIENNPTKEQIIRSAQECKMHCKFKNTRKLCIEYTPIENLTKATEVGAVYFKSAKNVKTIRI